LASLNTFKLVIEISLANILGTCENCANTKQQNNR